MKTILFILLSVSLCATESSNPKKEYFNNVNQAIPSITFEMRYFGVHNFVGKTIDTYEAPICFLTHETVHALTKVQKSLQTKGMTLRIFDCYRPQRAVEHFVRWAKALDDTKMKARFYPHVKKRNLFRDGYIAAKSGHSRGSTLDLSIDGLDMGTPFDYFDPRSRTNAKTVSKKQHANRMMLKKLMEENGFKNYAAEWWHYTLKDEPFKERYFDFVVK